MFVSPACSARTSSRAVSAVRSEPRLVDRRCAEQDETFGLCSPAGPRPLSPAGYARSWNSAFGSGATTGVDGGVEVVLSPRSGTFAYTGVAIHDSGRVVVRLPVRLRSIRARGVPPTRAVDLTTLTDTRGGFAFTNIPASARGSCFELSAPAGSQWTSLSTRWIVAADTVVTHPIELIHRRKPQRFLIDNVGVSPSARRQCARPNHH